MRKLFKDADEPPDGKEVDALFASLDADGGGDLSISELKQAFAMLQEESRKSKSNSADALVRAAKLREKAAGVREGVLAATHKSNEAAKELVRVRKEASVGSMLGDMINGQGLKAADLVKQWDTSGDGEIDKGEFREHVGAMARGSKERGFTATAQEIDDLFDSLDADHGGALDVKELKAAIKSLQDLAETRKNQLRVLGLALIAALKTTRAAQSDYKKQVVTEEAEEKEAREKAKLHAEADRLAAEEAKAAKLAAKAEKAARIAEEKAAADAKVEARRAANNKSPSSTMQQL